MMSFIPSKCGALVRSYLSRVPPVFITENMTDVDDVVTTQRGAPSIVFQGFTFRKDKTDDKGQLSFWRCRNKGCPGRLVVDAALRKARLTKPHAGHFPKAKVAQAAKIVVKVKELVVNEKVPVN